MSVPSRFSVFVPVAVEKSRTEFLGKVKRFFLLIGKGEGTNNQI